MSEQKICLLLEDDPDDKNYFVDTLRSISCSAGCYAANNGEKALFLLREQGLRPDYIFTDIHMPGMDGYRFIEELKASPDFRQIPVIVYSSVYNIDHLHRLRNLGVHACYSKWRFQLLPEILRQYFS